MNQRQFLFCQYAAYRQHFFIYNHSRLVICRFFLPLHLFWKFCLDDGYDLAAHDSSDRLPDALDGVEVVHVREDVLVPLSSSELRLKFSIKREKHSKSRMSHSIQCLLGVLFSLLEKSICDRAHVFLFFIYNLSNFQ